MKKYDDLKAKREIEVCRFNKNFLLFLFRLTFYFILIYFLSLKLSKKATQWVSASKTETMKMTCAFTSFFYLFLSLPRTKGKKQTKTHMQPLTIADIPGSQLMSIREQEVSFSTVWAKESNVYFKEK